MDPFGRPNFLYLTDTVRKKRLVDDDFVDYRGGGAFRPAVDTVSGLVDALVRRFGDGRVPWTLDAAALVAERLLLAENAGARWPWLSRVGPRGAPDLARLHRGWDEARRAQAPSAPELAGPRGQELGRFLGALHAALAADPRFLPSGEALRALVRRLHRPDDPLAAWLTRHPVVVVDDVLHPSPLRRDLLVALAAAWRALGVHVVFSFECGPGAALGRFFGYDDDEPAAFSLRPFGATRALRRELFERLSGEGEGVDLALAGPDGGLRMLDGTEGLLDDDGAPAETPDLSDRVDTPSAGPLPLHGLALRRLPDPAAEVRTIAHAVKDRLLAGAAPSELWVAFPGLPGWLPLVRRIFGELGIPFDSTTGHPLAPFPVARFVARVARLPAAGWPTTELFAALDGPAAGVATPGRVARLARRCREAGVRAGHPRSWSLGDLDAADAETLAAISAWADGLLPLRGPLRARAWRDQLTALVPGVVERLADEPTSLRALAAVLEAVEAVTRDADAAHPGEWDALRLAELLDERLAAGSLAEHASEGDRVQVVGMLELRGIHPPWLWIGGLLADDFGAGLVDDWLVSRADRRRLDEPDPAQEARYLLASAIRNVQADHQGELTLSWCETRDGARVAPSPLLEDLLELPLGEDSEGTLRVRVRPADPAPTPAGRAEAERALGAWLGRGAREGGAAEALDVALVAAEASLPGAAARLGPGLRLAAARADEAGFGPWDGVLPEGPALPPELPVTGFEDWLGCPMRFFLGRLLALSPEEPWDPDLGAQPRGTLLHAVLSTFVKGRLGAPLVDDAAERARLHRVATEALAAEDAVGALAPGLADWYRRRWLGGLLDDGRPGLLRTWLGWEAEREVVPTGVEVRLDGVPMGPLRLRGSADRVDELDGSVIVLDFKTGVAPEPAKVQAGLAVQGFVYLDALARGRPGAAGYVSLKPAEGPTTDGWLGDPAVLDALGVGKKALRLDDAAHAERRAALEAAAEKLAAGLFHPTLAGPALAGCEWCAMRRACHVDHERNEAVSAAGGDGLHRPLEVPGD